MREIHLHLVLGPRWEFLGKNTIFTGTFATIAILKKFFFKHFTDKAIFAMIELPQESGGNTGLTTPFPLVMGDPHTQPTNVSKLRDEYDTSISCWTCRKKLNLCTIFCSIRDLIKDKQRTKGSLPSQVWAVGFSGDRLVPGKSVDRPLRAELNGAASAPAVSTSSFPFGEREESFSISAQCVSPTPPFVWGELDPAGPLIALVLL